MALLFEKATDGIAYDDSRGKGEVDRLEGVNPANGTEFQSLTREGQPAVEPDRYGLIYLLYWAALRFVAAGWL